MSRIATPPGTTVLIAGHDTWKGAYLWRNGLAFASRLHGLRRDLKWTHGTAAILPDASGLGVNVFEIGLDASGHAVDWTACERALRQPDVPVLASFQWPSTATTETPSLALARATQAPAIRLRFADCPRAPARSHKGNHGRLYWRQGPGTLSRRFNVTDARIFRMPAGGHGEVVIRLGPTKEAIGTLELRIETVRPSWRDCLREVEVLGGPPSGVAGAPVLATVEPIGAGSGPPGRRDRRRSWTPP